MRHFYLPICLFGILQLLWNQPVVEFVLLNFDHAQRNERAHDGKQHNNNSVSIFVATLTLHLTNNFNYPIHSFRLERTSWRPQRCCLPSPWGRRWHARPRCPCHSPPRSPRSRWWRNVLLPALDINQMKYIRHSSDEMEILGVATCWMHWEVTLLAFTTSEALALNLSTSLWTVKRTWTLTDIFRSSGNIV